MTDKSHNISIKLATLLLAFVLILPSVVKFSHALSNHEHEVCIDISQDHFHSIDIDCEFYKFKIQTQSPVSIANYELFSIENNHPISKSYYVFLSDYQRLHFSLRGPPFNN